jgi:hypothetical protein
MRPMFQIRSLCRLLLIAALPVLASSCSNPAAEEFKRNEQRWKSQNITDYGYKLRMECYCPLQYIGPNRIEVRRGVAESITYAGDGKNINMSGVRLPDTMEKLFDIIRGQADQMTVTYDPTYGYPTSIHTIDRRVTHDNFTIYAVSDFEVRK